MWTFESQTEYMLSLYGEIDTSGGDATVYHGDMIGSTMITSRLENDPPGQESVEAVAAVAYTAFGEVVELTGTPDPNDANVTIWNASIGGALPEGFPRYAYAGQHGYESGLLSRTGANPNLPPITLQHLGWRWYDPSIGRFVQRDPIGIAGGMNVYLYVDNTPTMYTDASGLTKGGKRKIDPSDKPSDWDRISLAEKIKYCGKMIANPKSPEHQEVWRGFKKTLKRLGKKFGIIGTVFSPPDFSKPEKQFMGDFLWPLCPPEFGPQEDYHRKIARDVGFPAYVPIID